MKSNLLTAKGIVKATKTPGTYRDGAGLELKVGASGSASWLLITRFEGKRPEIGLGSLNDVSLAEAREKANRVRAEARRGIDPRSAGGSAVRRRSGAPPFREIAAAYIASQAPGWKNKKHAAQWTSTLATYADPVIGDLPVDKIELQHIEQVLRGIWYTKSETASRVRGRIEAVLGLAIVLKHRPPPNPAIWAGNLSFVFPEKSKVAPVKHLPAMPYSELPAFMRELRDRPTLGARALEFTILNAARTGETCGALWEEIEGDVWVVPGERMKMGKEHRSPLGPRSLEILADLPRVSAYLFPGRSSGAISNNTMRKTLQDLGHRDLTVHGFRSTFKDWAAEVSSTPGAGSLSEAQLAHTIQNSSQAAYERGDKLSKRRGMLAEWEGYAYASE